MTLELPHQKHFPLDKQITDRNQNAVLAFLHGFAIVQQYILWFCASGIRMVWDDPEISRRFKAG